MTLLQMSRSYRSSAEMIRLRIIYLKDEARRAEGPEKDGLERRIRDLRVLYRETRETALVLERYYQGRRCEE